MTHLKRSATTILLVVCAGAAGCGGSGGGQITPSSRLESMRGSPTGKIVLTAEGAQRVGIQTAPVRTSSGTGGSVVIPFSAIVYDPNGRTFAFTNPAPLTYVEVPVRIDHITGDSAYLRGGPPAGARVVSVGAEELFGVQTGVLAQT